MKIKLGKEKMTFIYVLPLENGTTGMENGKMIENGSPPAEDESGTTDPEILSGDQALKSRAAKLFAACRQKCAACSCRPSCMTKPNTESEDDDIGHNRSDGNHKARHSTPLPKVTIEDETGKSTSRSGCFRCLRNKNLIDEPENEDMRKTSCFNCWRKKRLEDSEGNEKTGCFPCCGKRKRDMNSQDDLGDSKERIIVSSTTKDTEEPSSKRMSCMDRLKSCCCRSNKIADADESTGCCPRVKGRDNWAMRRDSIVGIVRQSKSTRCKEIFMRIFCCCFASQCCKRKGPPPPKIEETSRRESMMSKKKSLTPTVLPPEEPKNKIDSSLVDYTSTMKAAIPILPVWLAYFCLIMNMLLPGTGTVFSGLFCLCLGIPRFSQKDGARPRIGSFIINVIVGCCQFFTVLFCLVGWGWSIWWGFIMLKVAKKHRKIKILESRIEASQDKMNQANENSRKDIEKGRT